MVRAHRLSEILALLATRDRISIEEIVAHFAVSPATARRDLDTLSEQRLVRRTHGGAARLSGSFDLPLLYKDRHHSEAKRAIARRAAPLIMPGMTIGLTGGTTVAALGATIAAVHGGDSAGDEPPLTVMTNAIDIAATLVLRPQIRVVVPGGVVHARSFELIGPFALETLRQVSLDLAFIGVNALDPEHGAMVHDDDEARVNRMMAERATSAYVLADSSKIGQRALARVGGQELFTGIITDVGIRPEQRRALEDAGFNVHLAPL